MGEAFAGSHNQEEEEGEEGSSFNTASFTGFCRGLHAIDFESTSAAAFGSDALLPFFWRTVCRHDALRVQTHAVSGELSANGFLFWGGFLEFKLRSRRSGAFEAGTWRRRIRFGVGSIVTIRILFSYHSHHRSRRSVPRQTRSKSITQTSIARFFP